MSFFKININVHPQIVTHLHGIFNIMLSFVNCCHLWICSALIHFLCVFFPSYLFAYRWLNVHLFTFVISCGLNYEVHREPAMNDQQSSSIKLFNTLFSIKLQHEWIGSKFWNNWRRQFGDSIFRKCFWLNETKKCINLM